MAADRPVAVQVRRWADASYPVDLGTSPSRVTALPVPADSFTDPWIARVETSGPINICPLSPG